MDCGRRGCIPRYRRRRKQHRKEVSAMWGSVGIVVGVLLVWVLAVWAVMLLIGG